MQTYTIKNIRTRSDNTLLGLVLDIPLVTGKETRHLSKLFSTL